LIFENKKDAHYTMTDKDNKLVKMIMDAAVLTGLIARIGWIAKTVVKDNFTSDPSSSAMNYAKFTAVLAGSIALKDYLKDKKFFRLRFRKKKRNINGKHCNDDWRRDS